MQVNRIARTRTQDLQPLGTAGQFAFESWAVLTALLGRELSSDHAALLAEPMQDPNRGETDWYSVRSGPAVPLSSLPASAQATLGQRLHTLVGDIDALGNRFLASRSDAERFTGELVKLCIQIPDQDRIMVVGGEPVLVGWGHSQAGATAVPAVLIGRKTALTPAALPIPAGAPDWGPMTPFPTVGPPEGAPAFILPPPHAWRPAASRAAPRLLVGLLLSILLGAGLAAVLVLFDPFGWTGETIAQCVVPESQTALAATLQNAVAREGALQLESARLSADAGRRRLQCLPGAGQSPPPANADIQRAAHQGASIGKLQIILAWDDANDLDLRLICPGGDVIDYQHRQTCGGTLDIDANGDAAHLTDKAVENVFFPDPQPGRYQVLVDPYRMRVGASTGFRVTIHQDGKPDRELTGTAQDGRHNQPVADIEIASRP